MAESVGGVSSQVEALVRILREKGIAFTDERMASFASVAEVCDAVDALRTKVIIPESVEKVLTRVREGGAVRPLGSQPAAILQGNAPLRIGGRMMQKSPIQSAVDRAADPSRRTVPKEEPEEKEPEVKRLPEPPHYLRNLRQFEALGWGPRGRASDIVTSGRDVRFRRYGWSALGQGLRIDLGVPQPGDALLVIRHREWGVGATVRLPSIDHPEGIREKFFTSLQRMMHWRDGSDERELKKIALKRIRQYYAVFHDQALAEEEQERLFDDPRRFVLAFEIGKPLQTIGRSDRARMEDFEIGVFLVAGLPLFNDRSVPPAMVAPFLGAAHLYGLAPDAVTIVQADDDLQSMIPLRFDPATGMIGRSGRVVAQTTGNRAAGKQISLLVELDERIRRAKLGSGAEALARDYLLPTAIGLWWSDPKRLQQEMGAVIAEARKLRGGKRTKLVRERYNAWLELVPALSSTNVSGGAAGGGSTSRTPTNEPSKGSPPEASGRSTRFAGFVDVDDEGGRSDAATLLLFGGAEAIDMPEALAVEGRLPIVTPSSPLPAAVTAARPFVY